MTSERQAPGPPDYWLLRNLIPLARQPLKGYLATWREHGDMVRLHWMGQKNAYLLVHPEAVERVFQSNWTNYPKSVFARRLAVFTGKGLFTSEGDLWLRQRRLAQPAFHRQKLAAMAQIIARSVDEMLDRWDRAPAIPFELSEEMMVLTLDVVLRTLFGAELDLETINWLHQRSDIALEHIDHRFRPLSLPESIPTPRNLRFLRAKAELEEWIMALVARRRESGSRPDDLLSLLLDARDLDSGEGMSDRQLLDEINTLLVAGHETTANSLAWSMALLSCHPGARDDLEMQAAATHPSRLPTFDDLSKLTCAHQIFMEALRLYPPIWVMGKQALTDDIVGGYPVQAKSTILLVPYLTHRHPEFWPEPEKFDPRRFDADQVAARPRFAHFAFGGGPRLCIGQNFALMEGQIILSAIASRYRLDLVGGAMPEIAPRFTLRAAGGIWVTRHKCH